MVALNDLPDEIILGIASLVRVRQSPSRLLFDYEHDSTMAEDLSLEREGLRSFFMVNRRIHRIVFTAWYSVIQLHGNGDGLLKMAKLLRTFRENPEAAAAVRQFYVYANPILHRSIPAFLNHKQEVAFIYDKARSVGSLDNGSWFPAWDDLDYSFKDFYGDPDGPEPYMEVIEDDLAQGSSDLELLCALTQILLLHKVGLREFIPVVPWCTWTVLRSIKANFDNSAGDARCLLPKLTTLTLRPAPPSAEEVDRALLCGRDIAIFYNMAPNITELYLQSRYGHEGPWPLCRPTKISHLTLSAMSLSTKELQAAVGSCEALSTFKYIPSAVGRLRNTTKVQPGEVIQALLPHAMTLKTLCLEYCDTYPNFLISKPAGRLHEFTELENLWIDAFSVCGTLSGGGKLTDSEMARLLAFFESLPSSLERLHWVDNLLGDKFYLKWMVENLERFPYQYHTGQSTVGKSNLEHTLVAEHQAAIAHYNTCANEFNELSDLVEGMKDTMQEQMDHAEAELAKMGPNGTYAKLFEEQMDKYRKETEKMFKEKYETDMERLATEMVQAIKKRKREYDDKEEAVEAKRVKLEKEQEELDSLRALLMAESTRQKASDTLDGNHHPEKDSNTAGDRTLMAGEKTVAQHGGGGHGVEDAMEMASV
ncbi:hypothetical protein CTRI78_v010625 [Colletotrichum trifolii]|uniref:F-box domain-containing protein n=1 Tax=Colletotrichum trifolii TaxID=5466 RepID=A0A4V6QEL6_COLTR|nr:hypothetical protein CTRI78_v010625 [Colletotrichum trifolii]